MVLSSTVWISMASPCAGFPAGPTFSKVMVNCSLAGAAAIVAPAARITTTAAAYCNNDLMRGGRSEEAAVVSGGLFSIMRLFIMMLGDRSEEVVFTSYS